MLLPLPTTPRPLALPSCAGYFIYGTVDGVSFQPKDVPVGPVALKLVRGHPHAWLRSTAFDRPLMFTTPVLLAGRRQRGAWLGGGLAGVAPGHQAAGSGSARAWLRGAAWEPAAGARPCNVRGGGSWQGPAACELCSWRASFLRRCPRSPPSGSSPTTGASRCCSRCSSCASAVQSERRVRQPSGCHTHLCAAWPGRGNGLPGACPTERRALGGSHLCAAWPGPSRVAGCPPLPIDCPSACVAERCDAPAELQGRTPQPGVPAPSRVAAVANIALNRAKGAKGVPDTRPGAREEGGTHERTIESGLLNTLRRYSASGFTRVARLHSAAGATRRPSFLAPRRRSSPPTGLPFAASSPRRHGAAARALAPAADPDQLVAAAGWPLQPPTLPLPPDLEAAFSSAPCPAQVMESPSGAWMRWIGTRLP